MTRTRQAPQIRNNVKDYSENPHLYLAEEETFPHRQPALLDWQEDAQSVYYRQKTIDLGTR